MEESSGPPEAPDGLATPPQPGPPPIVDIAAAGDLVLDVTFENSKATLKAARQAERKLVTQTTPAQGLKPRVRLGFRVELVMLQRQSRYFEKLLGDTRFKEAKAITAALGALSLRGVEPAAAEAKDLAWIKIVDDDEATRYARREQVFADLLRILHGHDVTTTPVTMDYVTTLAVFADRFDCVAAVTKIMASGLKFKWPSTLRKAPAGEDVKMSHSAENVLRQKVLVAWLLNQPVKFQAATRELILSGSCKWTAFPDPNETEDEATWWYLQDGLEQELQYRRECILNTVASVPRHFLGLYASRTRQCNRGYDSSMSCDSYQLGEMFKFLTNKNLLFVVDFSPRSLDNIAETSLLNIEAVLATLRKCPGYQIDQHHTNCGLRTRMLPILDFIQALLSANSIPLTRMAWKNNKQAAAWFSPRPEGGGQGGGGDDDDVAAPSFRFTRAVAGDQRLRFEHAMGADQLAKEVFTAASWDWTADIETAPPVTSIGLPSRKMFM